MAAHETVRLGAAPSDPSLSLLNEAKRSLVMLKMLGRHVDAFQEKIESLCIPCQIERVASPAIEIADMLIQPASRGVSHGMVVADTAEDVAIASAELQKLFLALGKRDLESIDREIDFFCSPTACSKKQLDEATDALLVYSTTVGKTSLKDAWNSRNWTEQDRRTAVRMLVEKRAAMSRKITP